MYLTLLVVNLCEVVCALCSTASPGKSVLHWRSTSLESIRCVCIYVCVYRCLSVYTFFIFFKFTHFSAVEWSDWIVLSAKDEGWLLVWVEFCLHSVCCVSVDSPASTALEAWRKVQMLLSLSWLLLFIPGMTFWLLLGFVLYWDSIFCLLFRIFISEFCKRGLVVHFTIRRIYKLKQYLLQKFESCAVVFPYLSRHLCCSYNYQK